MIRGIDHLVVACADPDAAAAEIESELGIACTGGGRHAGRGTWNRIAWLADGSYLELIGVDDPDAALRQPIGAAAMRVLDSSGGGLATYALAADQLEQTVNALRGTGSSIAPVVSGSRLREDGELVEWRVAVPDEPLAADGVPFLIEHVPSGSEWGPAAVRDRRAFRHPIGSPVILTRLDVATADPPSLAARLHEQVGLDLWAVGDLAVCTVGTHVIRLVPSRKMPVRAEVRLGAAAQAGRAADLLGLRFTVERVEMPIP